MTDLDLTRIIDMIDSHVSTMLAETIGYVAVEDGQT